MGDSYKELFKVDYNGTVSELTDAINSLDGVERAATGEAAHREVYKTLDYNITYDTHLTDRTQVANNIEAIDGVESVTFG